MQSTYLKLDEIKNLRRKIRKARLALNCYELKKAEREALTYVLKLVRARGCQHIGLYLDAFGELPTRHLMIELIKRKKSVYLPLICSMNNSLHWQKISMQQLRNQRFALHKLGMKQAMQSRGVLSSQLDCMIMPLVIFDENGHRVGMGGGFYDRTLAKYPRKPIRVGYAHQFQKSELLLQVQKWDQSLDYICTPKMMKRFNR